jgi:hypothetical protein
MVDVWIRLTGDVDGDGSPDIVDVQTGADGKFSFLDLHPGTYTVEELFTDGATWLATVDHNADTIGDNTTTVTIQSGEELVAFEGDAGLDPSDPREEVLAFDNGIGGPGYGLIFGNHEVGQPGLTPGFWANHLYVWDGVEDNGPQDGQGRYHADKLADAGVISAAEILDYYHQDLVFEGTGGQTLVIEWDDAEEIVNQGNKKGGDKLYDFVRYAITTLLNEAGVPNFSMPSGLMADIADWLIDNGPTTDVGGNNVLTYNNAGEPGSDGFPPGSRIKANSDAWQMSGSDIFDTMTSLTHDASTMMVTSLDGSHVFLAVNNGDYLGLITGTLNVGSNYLLL